MMTEAQELHLENIIDEFACLTDPKYRKGAEEHGGDLNDMTPLQLVENAMLEAVDQFVYLYTLRTKLMEK